jgi:hypothetical protein
MVADHPHRRPRYDREQAFALERERRAQVRRVAEALFAPNCWYRNNQRTNRLARRGFWVPPATKPTVTVTPENAKAGGDAG